MTHSNYEKAKEWRDWTNWLFTALMPVLFAATLWLGKTLIENHDLKWSAELQKTYATKSEIATESTERNTHDLALQRQITETNNKLDSIDRGVGKIEQKVDDLKDQIARVKNKNP